MPPRNIRPVILPAVVGNALEWYDLTFYGYFAGVFARLYFPNEDPFLSLLAAYGLFAASYFMRPLGAMIFGYVGDKYGRKYSLAYSIIIMGACSLLISLLPTYAQWGASASVFLIILRLLQGFAVGGEYSGASIYLIESAPKGKRTFYGSLALSSAYSGFLLSSIVGALLSAFLSEESLLAWGWRLGFLFGAIIALIGFYVRKKLQDTPAYKNEREAHHRQVNPIKNLLYNHPKQFLIALGIALLPAGSTYMILVYSASFIELYGNYSSRYVLNINTIMMIFIVVIIPFIGLLADRIGRKKVMYTAAILMIIFCLPLFQLLLYYPLIALLSLAFLSVLFEANVPTEVAEMFPVSFRYTGLALTLNVTNGIAGGLAPIIATVLIHTTNILVSPMFYVIGFGVITLFSLKIHFRNK